MNGLAFIDTDVDWNIAISKKRGKLAYCNKRDTSVSYLDFTQNGDALPVGFGRLDDLLDELESDTSLQDGLAEARREIAEAEVASGKVSLATLRMARGLSQIEFAGLLGTSQAAISRLESGQQEPRLATLRKMAEVLHVDMNTLTAALPA